MLACVYVRTHVLVDVCMCVCVCVCVCIYMFVCVGARVCVWACVCFVLFCFALLCVCAGVFRCAQSLVWLLVADAGGGWGGVAGWRCAGAVLGAAAGCGPPSSPRCHVLYSDSCLRSIGKHQRILPRTGARRGLCSC